MQFEGAGHLQGLQTVVVGYAQLYVGIHVLVVGTHDVPPGRDDVRDALVLPTLLHGTLNVEASMSTSLAVSQATRMTWPSGTASNETKLTAALAIGGRQAAENATTATTTTRPAPTLAPIAERL